MKVTVKKQVGDFLIEVSIDGITDGVGSKVEEILDTLNGDRNLGHQDETEDA